MNYSHELDIKFLEILDLYRKDFSFVSKRLFICMETTFHLYRNDFLFVSKRLFICIETTSICIETTCIETTLYRNDRTPVDMSTEMCRSTYRPTHRSNIGRYVDRHSTDTSVDMSTESDCPIVGRHVDR